MPDRVDEWGGVALEEPTQDEFGGQLVPEPTRQRTILPEVPRFPEEAGAEPSEMGRQQAMFGRIPPAPTERAPTIPGTTPEGGISPVQAIARVGGEALRTIGQVVNPMTYLPEEEVPKPFIISPEGIRQMTTREARARSPLYSPDVPLLPVRGTQLEPTGSDAARQIASLSTLDNIALMATGAESQVVGLAMLADMAPQAYSAVKNIARSDIAPEEKRDQINALVMPLAIGLRHMKPEAAETKITPKPFPGVRTTELPPERPMAGARVPIEPLKPAEAAPVPQEPTPTPLTTTSILPDYDPQNLGMRERLRRKKEQGRTHDEANAEISSENQYVENEIQKLPSGTRVRNKDGMLYENVALEGDAPDWVQVDEKTGDILSGSVSTSMNLRGGKVERFGTGKVKPSKPAEAAPTPEAPTPTLLTPAEQAAERARLAAELGEEPEVAAAPAKPTPPPPVPEVASMGPTTASGKDPFGNPYGTKYHSTPEDWAKWQSAQASLERAKAANDFGAMSRIGPEIEALKGNYGGQPPQPPKLTPADLEPALLVNGNPVTGGADHEAIFKKATTEADTPEAAAAIFDAMEDDSKHVFVDKDRNIYSRDQARIALGEKEPLKSERLAELKKKTEVPTAKAPTPEVPTEPAYTGADAIEIVGKPLGEWFKAKSAADLPKGKKRTDLANKIGAKSPKQKDILARLKQQDRVRGFVSDLAKPLLKPEEAIPMEAPTIAPTATETTPPVPAVEIPKTAEAKSSEEPPKGPGPIGMGGAVPEEFEHNPSTPTGIRNAVVDKERAKRGLPAAMQAARRSFGEVWDRAMALIDRDPTTQDELLDSLRDKPRALTDTEDALVLHRQIDLQNEYGKATRDLAQAFDDGRMDDVARERTRVASLSDKLLDIYNIGKTSGTETARGLSARRMMANEDFTLARMITEKRAANQGKPLTEAQNAEIERLNKIIERTQKALDEFEKREAERRGGGPPPGTPPRPDPELERIKADNERAKREYRESLARDRLKQRTPLEKTQDWLVKWRRAFVLSSPITIAKLTSAAVQRMTFTPIEEILGAGISKAIPSVASKASREGGINARAEARALTEGFTKGMRDSWDVLRTGKSSLDVLYGRAAGYPPGVSDVFGHIHGALKSVTKRNEFARSFEKRSAAAIAQGVDVSDPFVQTNLAVEAYKDANRSIFLQDNRVVTAYKAALRVLEQRSKETGKTPAGAKAVATTAKLLLPIIRVPTNIVAETIQSATGLVTGSARLGRAFARGIEKLEPAEADLIMRSLKKGSIGAAVLALGYINADVIGGYYQPGKRKPEDVKFGKVRLYGYDIPSYLLHNPLLETLQIGATIRRFAESKMAKKDAESQGVAWATVGAGMGLLEEVPFLRETIELAKTFRQSERRQFFGELFKSLTVPQGIQWWAAYNDTDQYGRPIARKPGTVVESIKTGIPGLREEVPAKKPTPTK